ncbi:hypothetical protein FH593_20640 (plasmid) [Leptospira interrogans]|uniref:hypothetical protein n=1 Tax=Leptospira interrogans TaxID=173 RepID=UPI0002BF748C|nr:hypothetical protein [Leptospira interrogans]EMN60296.1 hypothetical protein LEP1GSC092_0026 [Leptospira interrogans serovar Pyrogenes str. R168]ULG90652.1 hypothetical protein FH593_20640 [Leptospira interrogans]UML78420.1 hypothetical protein FH583_21755 [Leptospira interrogans]
MKYLELVPVFTFYLKEKLPDLIPNIYPNTTNADTKTKFILVKSRGGNQADIYSGKLVSKSIHLLIQDSEEKLARQTAYRIYNALQEKFDLLLNVPALLLDSEGAGPPSTPSGIVPIRLARIAPIDEPYSLGSTDKGFYQYSLNYNVVGRFLIP